MTWASAVSVESWGESPSERGGGSKVLAAFLLSLAEKGGSCSWRDGGGDERSVCTSKAGTLRGCFSPGFGIKLASSMGKRKVRCGPVRHWTPPNPCLEAVFDSLGNFPCSLRELTIACVVNHCKTSRARGLLRRF